MNGSKWTLALDPGLVNPAAALFRDGVLVSASRVKLSREWSKLPMAARCLTIAREVVKWLDSYGPYRPDSDKAMLHLDFVFEWPQIYRGIKAKGDPNDLPPLAALGMAVSAILWERQAARYFTVRSYLPREWAGNIPKTTKGDPLSSIRGQRVWKRLSEVEREAVVLSHDAIDAVGIGLKFLGRYEIIRVYPGATSEPEPAPGEG